MGQQAGRHASMWVVVTWRCGWRLPLRDADSKPAPTTPVSLANLLHQTDASGKSVHTAQPVRQAGRQPEGGRVLANDCGHGAWCVGGRSRSSRRSRSFRASNRRWAVGAPTVVCGTALWAASPRMVPR